MKNVRAILFYILLVSLSLSSQEALSQALDPIEQQIDSIFSAYNAPHKPGAAVAVVKNGQLVFAKGYGSANLEYDLPVTTSTVFPVASLSKQFTVFSILLLADRGELSLDDDIRKYIPEVPDFGHTITLRHLATHTSGLREQSGLLGMAGWRNDDVKTKEQILKLIAKQKVLNFAPGEKHLYCNTGFTLLAEVVAKISGQSFAAFTKANIFDPLGMTNTLFYDNHEKIVKNRAYSYWSNGSATEFYKGGLNEGLVGNSGLFTTIEDMSLWAMNFSKPTVGNANIVSQMNTLATLNNGKTFGGAYGQYISKYKGLHQIYHGGSVAGFRTYLGRFPDQEFVVIVFSNYESTNANWLSMQVTDLYLNDYLSSPTSVTEKQEDSPTKIAATDLEAFVGYYWDEERFTSSRIYVENDTLMWGIEEGPGRPLGPIGENKFKRLHTTRNLTVEFAMTDTVKTMLITVDDLVPITCERYTPVSYPQEDLAQFTGTFFSEELNTSYSLYIREGQLVVERPRINDINLRAVQKDMFSGDYNIKYIRGANHSIIGIEVSSFQVRNLFFEKI